RRFPHWKWLFLMPALLPYLVIVLVPSLQGVAVAFTDWDGPDPQLDSVGLFNFQLIFQDATNIRALINTFLYAGVSPIAQQPTGTASTPSSTSSDCSTSSSSSRTPPT